MATPIEPEPAGGTPPRDAALPDAALMDDLECWLAAHRRLDEQMRGRTVYAESDLEAGEGRPAGPPGCRR